MKNIIFFLFAIVIVGGLLFIFTQATNNSQIELQENPTGNNDTRNSQSGAQNQTNCIIIISGAEYDVTPLRRSHSGGDIFRCGADMTRDFSQQHNMDLLMIEQYKI